MLARKFITIANSLSAAGAAIKMRFSLTSSLKGKKSLDETADEDLGALYKSLFVLIEHVSDNLKKVFKKRILGIPAGDYEDEAVPLKLYKVSKMPWSNLSAISNFAGCGNLLLAQLTGACPYEIRDFMRPLLKVFGEQPENVHLDKKALKSGGYIPSELMCAFLNKHGILTIPITARDLCPRSRIIENPITKDHVLLVSMLVAKNELTWCIYYQGACYHNIEINKKADCYDILNNPVQEMFILFNPSWCFETIQDDDLMFAC